MNLTEIAMAAAITVSVAGVSYAAFNAGELSRVTVKAADQVTCRTVEDAIVAYVGQYETTPTRVAQLRPYIKGDVSAYKIVRGRAAGPGC